MAEGKCGNTSKQEQQEKEILAKDEVNKQVKETVKLSSKSMGLKSLLVNGDIEYMTSYGSEDKSVVIEKK